MDQARNVNVQVNVRSKIEPSANLGQMRRELERQLGQPITIGTNLRLGDGFKRLQDDIERRQQAIQFRENLRSDPAFEKMMEAKKAARSVQEFISPAYAASLQSELELKHERKEALKAPTTKHELQGALAELQQQHGRVTPGGDQQIAIARQMLQVQRELAQIQKQENRASLIAQHGSGIAGLKEFESKLHGIERTALGVYNTLDNTITRFASALPVTGATFHESIQYFNRQVGHIFAPQLREFSFMVQRAGNWVKNLDDNTKHAIGTTAGWGAALSLAAYGGVKMYQAVASVATAGAKIGLSGRTMALAGGLGGLALAGHGAGIIAGDTPLGRAGSIVGNAAGAAALLGPSAAIPAALATYAYQRFFSERRPLEAFRGATPSESERARAGLVRGRLEALEGATAIGLPNARRPDQRMAALREALRGSGVTAEQLGISREDLDNIGFSNRIGAGRLDAIERRVATGLAGRRDNPDTIEARAAFLEGTGDRAGAARERFRAERARSDELFMSMGGFQSQQIDIGSLHRAIQAESVRPESEQRMFADAVKDFKATVDKMAELEAKARALGVEDF